MAANWQSTPGLSQNRDSVSLIYGKLISEKMNIDVENLWMP